MTVEKMNVDGCNEKKKSTVTEVYWLLVSVILYCQTMVIGIDNSFHEYC